MKKRWLFILIIILFLIPSQVASAAPGEEEIPKVTQIRGKVYVNKVGGLSTISAYNGMQIHSGDVITTDIGSSITIKYYGKEVMIGECTQVSMNSMWYRHERDYSSIVLTEGMIKNRINDELNNNSKNEIRTSNTIAGVRGTEYILIYSRMGLADGGDENPYSQLKVIDGTVRFDLQEEEEGGGYSSQGYLIGIDGAMLLDEDINGNQTISELDKVIQNFNVSAEDLDASILQSIKNDGRIMNQNGDYFKNIDSIIQQKKEEKKEVTKPDNTIIFSSDAEEVLPSLPSPSPSTAPKASSAPVQPSAPAQTPTPVSSKAPAAPASTPAPTPAPAPAPTPAPTPNPTPAPAPRPPAKKDQTAITINEPGEKTYGDAAFALGISGGSGSGAVSYAVSSGTAVSVSSAGMVTINHAGRATITVTKAGDSSYHTLSVSKTITINKKEITSVTIADISDQIYTGSAITPTPVVTDGSENLITSSDYSVSYSDNTDVAEITLTITATEGGNYKGDKSTTFEIVQRNLSTVTIASTESQTYTGSAITPTPAVTYESMTLVKDTDYTLSYSSNTSAGTATLTITAVANGNYTGSQSSDFTISMAAQADITYTLPTTITYGDAAFNLSASGGSGTSSFTYSVSSTTTALSVSDAGVVSINSKGSGVVTITKASDDNYSEKSVDIEITVAARNMSNITIADITGQVYTGSALTPTPSVTDGSNSLITSTDYSVSYSSNTNAGTATVTIAATTDGNYTGSKNKTFTIAKKALSVTADNIGSVTYGDAKPTYTVTYSGFVTGEDASDLTGTLQYTCTYAAGSAAGTYTITPSGYTAANYEITHSTGTLTVGKRALSVVTIADITSQAYTGSAITPTPSVTDSGLITSNDYSVSYSNNTAAGTATLTITATTGGNYTGSKSTTFTISAAAQGDITYTLPTTITYGDAAFNLSASGGSGTGSFTYSVSSTTTAISVSDAGVVSINSKGSGVITITKASDGNYNEKSVDITVTVAARSISNAAIADITGQVYTGSALTPTPTVTDGSENLITTDDYSVSYSNNTGAGTATVTITAATDGNYTGSKDKTFTIAKKALSVTANNVGGVTYGDAKPTYTAACSGFITGEDTSVLTGTLQYTCAYDVGSAAGTYTITPSGYTSANYAITYSTGTLTVGKRALSAVTIADITGQVYTGSALTPTPSVTDSGLVATSDYSVSYSNNTAAGTATLTITATASGNYSGSATKNYTIAKRALSDVSVADITGQTYTGSALTPAVTVTYNSMTLTKNTDYSVSYSSNTAAGTATATITAASDSNYTGTTTKDFTIAKANQAALAITDPGSKTYGDAAFSLSYTGGTTGSVSYAVTSGSAVSVSGSTVTIVAAGTAVITATCAGGTNYNDVTAQRTITVGQKSLTVSFSVATKAYDATAAATITSPTLSGVVSADTSNVSVSVGSGKSATFVNSSDVADINAGTNKKVIAVASDFVLAGSKSANYAISTVNSTTGTITKKPITVTGTVATNLTAANMLSPLDTTGTVTVSATGIINNDTLTYTLTTSASGISMTPTAGSPVGLAYSSGYGNVVYNIVVAADTAGTANHNYQCVSDASNPNTVTIKMRDGTNGYPIPVGSYNIAAFNSYANTSTGLSKSYQLAQDVPSAGAWTAIGTAAAPFSGKFNGKGHKIGYSISKNEAGSFGLFGYVNGGTIENVAVSGSINIGCVEASGYAATGLIVGYLASGTIQNCYSEGSVVNCWNDSKSGAGTAGAFLGGICGWSSGTISKCYSTAQVGSTATGRHDYNRIGGIVGHSVGTLSRCVSLNSGVFVSGTAQFGTGAGIGRIAGHASGGYDSTANWGMGTKSNSTYYCATSSKEGCSHRTGTDASGLNTEGENSTVNATSYAGFWGSTSYVALDSTIWKQGGTMTVNGVANITYPIFVTTMTLD